MKTTSGIYLVSAILHGHLKQGFYEAMSAKHAMYIFCRECGLNEADDVPGLRADCISNEKEDTFFAANEGYLE